MQSLANSMMKFVEPSTSTSSVEVGVLTLPESQSDDVEVNEKPDRSHGSEEQIREDIHEETEEINEIDNFKDNHNEEGNKLEDGTSDGKEEGEEKVVDEEETEELKENENVKDIYNEEGNKLEDSASDEEEEGEEVADEEETISNVLFSDISDWPFPVPDTLRVDLIKRGSEAFQNKDGPFGSVKRQGDKTKGLNRQLTAHWFYISQPNGEKIPRTWMAYSIKKQSLYCFCCRLFGTDASLSNTSKFVTGFQAWWKLSPKVHNHETSEQHETYFERRKTLRTGLIANKTIDQVNQAATETEKSKWRNILKRLLDVTIFLAKQNLPFRGHRENMLSENKGNFLQVIELLSKYDPVLREHIIKLEQSTQSQMGKILTSYLSPPRKMSLSHFWVELLRKGF